MKNRFIIGVFIGAVVLLVLLILFGPGAENKKESGILWETAFTRIEYIPGKGRRIKKVADAVKLGFDRAPGFFRDEFEISSASGGQAGNKVVRRRGSNLIKAVFDDWSRLRIKGYFQSTAGKRTADAGLDDTSDQLRLYKKKDSKPIIVRIGRKSKNGNILALVNGREGSQGLVYVLPGHIVQRVLRPYVDFRARRPLLLTARTHITRLKVQGVISGSKRNIVLNRKKRQNKGRTQIVYEDDSGKLLPLRESVRLESMVRQLSVLTFGDEKKSKEPIADIWKRSSGNRVNIRARLSSGKNVAIELREILKPDRMRNAKPRALMREEGSEFIDFIAAQNMMRIVTALSRTLNPPPARRKKGRRVSRQRISPSIKRVKLRR